MKEDKSSLKKERAAPTKVIIRRLPPDLTDESFLEQVSPLPDYDYFHFAGADTSLGSYAFSRAYLNFKSTEDIVIFCEKFDGYIFVDGKGNEFPAIVEFAPFQKVVKKKPKKVDSKMNTIEQDPDYLKFLESQKEETTLSIAPPESYLEEIEAREQLLRANKGLLENTTPLVEYIKRKKEEKRLAIKRIREERKRRELERRKFKDDERRRRRDRELARESDYYKEEKTESTVQLLKNPKKDYETSSSSLDVKQRDSGFSPKTVKSNESRFFSGGDQNSKAGSKFKEDKVSSGRARESTKYQDDWKSRDSKLDKSRVTEKRPKEVAKKGDYSNNESPKSKSQAKPDLVDTKKVGRNEKDSANTKSNNKSEEVKGTTKSVALGRETSNESVNSNTNTTTHHTASEEQTCQSKAKTKDSRAKSVPIAAEQPQQVASGSKDTETKDSGKNVNRLSKDDSSKSDKKSRERVRNKDRPERALYVPGRKKTDTNSDQNKKS